MKKRLALLVIGVSVLFGIWLGLTACTTPVTSVDFAGTYTVTKAVYGDKVVEGEEAQANYPADKNFIQVIDSQNIIFMLGGYKIETTYTLEGNVLHVKDSAQTLDFTLSGNQLIYTDSVNNFTFYFTRN